MYALVHEGVVVRVGLPLRAALSDGRTVSNYPALPADVLHAEGWREVQDDGPPDHDPDTHYTTRELTVDGDEVVAVYAIHERPPEPEPEPDPLVERLDELEAEVRGIRERAAAAEVAHDDARKVRDAVAGSQ